MPMRIIFTLSVKSFHVSNRKYLVLPLAFPNFGIHNPNNFFRTPILYHKILFWSKLSSKVYDKFYYYVIKRPNVP